MLHYVRLYRLWLIVAASVLGLVIGFTIVAGVDDDGSAGADPASGPASAGDGSVPAAPVSTRPATPPPHTVPAVSIPKLNDQRLPVAEERLRSAGFLGWQTMDATGQGRVVVESNNWIVVEQNPPAGSVGPLATVVILAVKKPTDDHVPVPTASGVVPDVVCAELQDAQEALRRARFFLLTSKDATGQSRVAVIDRDWVVVGQSARPGTTPGLTTHIELAIVKYGEPSGGSGCPT